MIPSSTIFVEFFSSTLLGTVLTAVILVPSWLLRDHFSLQGIINAKRAQIAEHTMTAAEHPLLVTHTGLRHISRLRHVLFSALVSGGHTTQWLSFGVCLMHSPASAAPVTTDRLVRHPFRHH